MLSTKSDSKKQYIRQHAREVFVRRGFKGVTMKDIVDACGISRGGLYLYYNSLEDLFLEVLRLDHDHTQNMIEEAIMDRRPADEIFNAFLAEQKKIILSEEETLLAAACEYSFEHPETPVLRDRFNDTRQALEYLIRVGVRRGEFVCDRPQEAAYSILFAIEGMKLSFRTVHLSEEEIDQGFAGLRRSLGIS